MLERQQIIRALSRLSDLLKERNAAGEVCLLGGTAMVLGFKARPSTKDIDAIFAPAGLIRELAAIVNKNRIYRRTGSTIAPRVLSPRSTRPSSAICHSLKIC